MPSRTDDVQLPHRQRVRRRRRRGSNQPQRARPKSAPDQDRLAPHPVDPDARGKADQDEGEELDLAEEGDLEHARLQRDDRDQGQRQLRDRRAEDADCLGSPQVAEVPVEPEPTGSSQLHAKPPLR